MSLTPEQRFGFARLRCMECGTEIDTIRRDVDKAAEAHAFGPGPCETTPDMVVLL